ncbi:MAG TPA: hypothetical protein VGN95_17570 [Pyrinomonadaceae bacterium]|jgi:hypothetical protein|nr:hypothetical protein [Pyrinomonadaceae bacterium]
MSDTADSKVDPGKITGIYQLLGVFLAVVETFLGVWFFRAADITERSIAGGLMVVVLLTFLFAVLRWNLKKGEENRTPQVEGIGKLNLPDKQATVEQIKSPEPESYVGPNRSYIINRPPDDWNIKELSSTQWRSDALGITNKALVEKLSKKAKDSKDQEPKDIVVFETKVRTSVIPIPGQTTVDGRKIPTALEIPLATSLAIRPLGRAQPPFFMERPLVHNFTVAVNEVLGVATLQKQWSTTIPNTQRQRLVAELSQLVDNAIVNGQEGRSLTANSVVVGIEGDIQDYILLMQYPSLKDAADPELSRNQQILNSLMSSFRPIKVPNSEIMLKEFKAKADQNFEELMRIKGEDIFSVEFGVCIYKLSDKNLDDLDDLLRAIKMLKPFKVFAEQIQLHDDDLDKLWKSLQEAEEGNTLNFKENLEKLIKIAEAATTPVVNGSSPGVEGESKIADNKEQALPETDDHIH